MTEIMMKMPDKLANKIKPFSRWLPTIIELALLGFRTKAIEPVSDLIRFLEKSPSPSDVLLYHASRKSEEQLYRLVALSEAGALSRQEQAELRELEKLEHIVIMLKAHARKILQ